MIPETLKGISDKIKSGLSREKHIPGFVYTKDAKTGKQSYQINPHYIDADRTPWEMPVNPDYEILKGVNLRGAPKVVICNEAAASPRNPKLPTITQLEDTNYYKEHLMTQHFNRSGIAPAIEQKVITSPIESRPFAKNIASSPAIGVEYAYGVQIIEEGSKELEIKGHWPTPYPVAVDKGKIDINNHKASKLEGLAYVAHVRVPVNLYEFFDSPKEDTKNFNGELTIYDETRDQKTQQIFEELFQPKLEKIGKQVEDLRERPIKGILLSRVDLDYQFDNNLTSNYKKGELVIAASYLV
ncbi:Uncharacterised protein [uncultured archaeon]|nr:Uncharacterised protein [uncultured archaeon]